jgi:septal ring factor EnvC (AmiA/AmiB activator)
MSSDILDIFLQGEVLFGLVLLLLTVWIMRPIVRLSSETAKLRLHLARADQALSALQAELPAKREEIQRLNRLLRPVQVDHNKFQSFYTKAKRLYSEALKQQVQERRKQEPEISSSQQRREGRI